MLVGPALCPPPPEVEPWAHHLAWLGFPFLGQESCCGCHSYLNQLTFPAKAPGHLYLRLGMTKVADDGGCWGCDGRWGRGGAVPSPDPYDLLALMLCKFLLIEMPASQTGYL